MTKKLLTQLMALTISLPFLAIAADQPAPPAGTSTTGVDTRPKKPLSMREAIEKAVSNNLDVAIRKMDPDAAKLAVTQARSEFDPKRNFGAKLG